MESLNFEVRFEPLPGGYRAQVINSPFGEAAVDFRGPFLPPSQMEARAYRDFGTHLFNAVFQGEVLALLRKSLDQAAEQKGYLRLSLRLSNTPELAGLPWEFLYDPASGSYLALQNTSPILRYLEVPQPQRPLVAARPLKLLVVIATPLDFPPLNVDDEWQALHAALEELEQRELVQLERLETCTPLSLQRQLRQGEYHILHFIGHGIFDQASGEGALLFEDDTGFGKAVTSQHLNILLSDERHSLGLVVLNACKTSTASSSQPFSGIAQGLVRLGIPAVIANNFSIPDLAAVAFCRELYQALAEGLTVEAALVEGRKAMFNRGFAVEWGIPTLFLRSSFDGPLFATQALDIPKVVESLQQTLPASDPTPLQLVETLKGFEYYHTRLYEWKELHNYLNDILFTLGQFAREVERLDIRQGSLDPWSLARLWRPVAQKVDLLLDWSTSIRSISEVPFAETTQGLQGPFWAVQLHAARTRLNDLLNQDSVEVRELFDATFDFSDTAERSMYQADKNLRDTAGELYNLSRVALGSFRHDKV